MSTRTARLVLVVGLTAGSLVTATAALADPGPGTWTKITSPAAPGSTFLYHYQLAATATNQVIVSGSTSSDVTSVDIDCVLAGAAHGNQVEQLATAVPVVAGSFSAVGSLDGMYGQCRLRAVPTGVDPATAYLGSYSGPAIYEWAGGATDDANHVPYELLALDEQGPKIADALDAGQCGTGLLTTIETPGLEVDGASQPVCLVGLGVGNVPPSGPSNASSIKVDGHNAYLPYEVHSLLIEQESLSVTQSQLTTTFARTSAGVLTWTESAPLERCSAGEAYRPTATSCPSLTNTGVTFERTGTMNLSASAVTMQDRYVSSDTKQHTVAAGYEGSAETPPTGAVGYLFPGHGTTFHAATTNQVITGLGTKAATIVIRTDLDAFDGDPNASTLGLTYSRAPSKITFSSTDDGSEPDEFQMDYSLNVPARGTGYIRFVATEAATVAGVKPLGTSAQAAMVNAPKISSPKNNATITGHTITVKGTVSAGANGLPTSVSVAGHKATPSANGSYSVKITEPYGKHTLTVIATDSAGSTKSSSIKVTNKS